MDSIKIIFFGTSDFGAIILEELIENNYKPVLVVTTPDKPAGRKKILTPPPVKIVAQKYGLASYQSLHLKKSTPVDFLRNGKVDLIVTAAYGYILPKNILEIPKYGCLNVHPSLLPKYRGPSPIQTAILNGDKITGVTIILMDEKIDHGPILAAREWGLPNSKITYEELTKELAELGAKLLTETIPKWLKGEIKPLAQDESKASYTKILKKENGKIDWSRPAQEIERQIRAYHPWPGSFIFWKGKRIKILEADISKENKLIIKKVQPEAKKPMTFEEFLRGHPDFKL